MKALSPRRVALLVALGLVLVVTVTAPRVARAGAENLITNGGFEDGLAGWKPDAEHALLTDRRAARSGGACLVGEVTGANQALRLLRDVPVRAGNLYRFEVWARATNRTKLVLWATLPGAKARKLISAWERVPGKWRRFSTPVTVEQDGTLALQIIAPSSFGAPPGKMWLDDAALHETGLPPVVDVSKGVGFNDGPAMARASDGSLYVAWLSFRGGADSFQVARYVIDERSAGAQGLAPLRPAGAWQVLGGERTYLLGVTAVAAGGGAVVLYASEVEGNWDVYAATCGADGPGGPVRVTSHRGVDVKPAAATHGDSLWVAWESNRNGPREILAASVRDGDVSDPVSLSGAGASSYAPSLAVLESGEVCVAWHSFRENNYDIYLRRRSTDGMWGPVARLTRSPSIDRHPLLVSRGDELWLVYEHARTEKYNIGRTNARRLVVSKVTREGLMAPADLQKSPLHGRCEAASAAFDPTGRLWLAFLRPRLPRAGWDAFVTCWNGESWLAPEPVSARKGMDRRPAIALDPDAAGPRRGRAFVAFQADDIPRSWSGVERTPQAKSDVFVAVVDAKAPPAVAALGLEPLREPDDEFEPARLRVERGEDTPTPEIEYRGERLKLFFGDLHEHTDVSVCNRVGDQSIDESYQHMRDIARHDFACVTDHGYNLNPYLWSYTAKLARANCDPGRFLTFLAEEWTSSFEEYSEKHPYGFYGHRNLVFADPYFPRWWNARNRQTPAEVWEDLRKLGANFVQIPHQIADTGNVPTDWDFTDEVAQPVAEIFQTRGSYEHRGTPREAKRTTPKAGYFLQDAWARGIVIGVIASPDHGGGYGKACVYAPELTREAILDALRARRCYGTTAAKIVLDVRVDGHLMGEKVARAPGDTVEVRISVRAPAEIDRIEVCRNNRFVYASRPEGREAKLTFTDRDPLDARSYYYVRVVQKDGEIAWSSPVWFGAAVTPGPRSSARDGAE